jgi:hypothetical protein
VDVLKTPDVDASMIYHELRELAHASSAPVPRVKELLLALSSALDVEGLDPSTHAPKDLLEARTLPLRSPGCKTELHSASTEFVIVDREGDSGQFRGMVRCLDFSLRDVCHLRSFISWAGLQSRYLSSCVKESSRVFNNTGGGVPERNRDIKIKAYGLLR